MFLFVKLLFIREKVVETTVDVVVENKHKANLHTHTSKSREGALVETTNALFTSDLRIERDWREIRDEVLKLTER